MTQEERNQSTLVEEIGEFFGEVGRGERYAIPIRKGNSFESVKQNGIPSYQPKSVCYDSWETFWNS